jgi:predicted kinase
VSIVDGRPTLVLLNGPPASGKSTLAARYGVDHPLSLNLDIDLIRRQLGGWAEHQRESGLLARAIALQAVRVHLAAGYDVLVPQFLGRSAFIELLESVAVEAGATFAEIVLVLPVDEAIRRFEQRTRGSSDQVHAEAAAMVEGAGGQAQLRAMHEQLLNVLADRPGAVRLELSDLDVEAGYQALLAALGRITPPAA